MVQIATTLGNLVEKGISDLLTAASEYLKAKVDELTGTRAKTRDISWMPEPSQHAYISKKTEIVLAEQKLALALLDAEIAEAEARKLRAKTPHKPQPSHDHRHQKDRMQTLPGGAPVKKQQNERGEKPDVPFNGIKGIATQQLQNDDKKAQQA